MVFATPGPRAQGPATPRPSGLEAQGRAQGGQRTAPGGPEEAQGGCREGPGQGRARGEPGAVRVWMINCIMELTIMGLGAPPTSYFTPHEFSQPGRDSSQMGRDSCQPGTISSQIGRNSRQPGSNSRYPEELNGWEPGCTLCILGFLHVTPGTYHLSLNSSHLTPTRDDSCLPGTDSSRLGRDSSQPQRHSSQPQRHTSQPGTSYLTTLSSNHTPRTLRHRFINHQFKTLMSYLICHDPHLTPDASHLSFRIPDLLHLL